MVDSEEYDSNGSHEDYEDRRLRRWYERHNAVPGDSFCGTCERFGHSDDECQIDSD